MGGSRGWAKSEESPWVGDGQHVGAFGPRGSRLVSVKEVSLASEDDGLEYPEGGVCRVPAHM